MPSLASGARTEKMKFGHHGANHPVQNLSDKTVMVTSQNHGFTVSERDLPDTLEVTRCLGMHLLTVEESVFMEFIPEKNIRCYIEVTSVVQLLMNQGNPMGLGLANGPDLNLPTLKPDGA